MLQKTTRACIFLFLCLAAAFGLLLAAEGALRLGGYGRPRSLFVRSSEGGTRGHVVNPLFYAQFFPAENEAAMAQAPHWRWRVPEEKAPNCFRIFMLGGSVALGHVPDPAFNATSILESMLQTSFPDAQFEVYNMACFALNSHVMRAAAREALRLEPDLLVVYMGNNEYIGPYGPARAEFAEPPTPALVQRRITLGRLRLVQGLSALASDRQAGMPASVEDFFRNAVKQRPDAAGRMAMYDNFAANLEEICQLGAARDVITVLCTVGNNVRDWPPYSALHRPTLDEEGRRLWAQHHEAGIEAQQREDMDEGERFRWALGHYEAAAKIDDTRADLQFRLGQCYWALGQYEQARHAFTMARDYDCFPIRGDSFINQRIRETAVVAGTLLADTEAAFMERCSHDIMSDDVFFDAMHLLFEGNYVIASTVFDAAKATIAARLEAEAPGDAPSLESCAMRLGLSPYLKAYHLRVTLDEVERGMVFLYEELGISTDPLRARLEEMEARLDASALDEAIETFSRALELRRNDFYAMRVLDGLRAQKDGAKRD